MGEKWVGWSRAAQDAAGDVSAPVVEPAEDEPPRAPDRPDRDRAGEFRWLVFGLVAIGWAVWLFGLLVVVACASIQSNPDLAAPNDPCAGLERAVAFGFVFLCVASFAAINYSSKHSKAALMEGSRRTT